MQQIPLPFASLALYLQEDFVVSDANKDAHRWLMAWPNWHSHAVLLIGAPASGKTHLATLWQALSNALKLEVTRLGQYPADTLLQNHDAALIDGVEAVQDEAALCQLLNHAQANGKTLLLTASTAPDAFNIATADLRSRLQALPQLTLQPPDDLLLKTLLFKQLSDRQLAISPAQLDYCIRHMERSYQGVAQLAEALDNEAMTRQHPLTQPMIKDVVGRLHFIKPRLP